MNGKEEQVRSWILGIDIAKAKFDVALVRDKEVVSGSFRNEAAGFTKLGRWLRKRGAKQVWACMEATGQYGEELALYLHEQGHQVSVVNPARIKAYGESKLQRNKNDKVDARLTADFCRTQEPYLWEPPPEEVRILQALSRRLLALQNDQTREKNRLQAGSLPAAVAASITAHLAFLAAEIARIEAQIQQHIDDHPDLKRNQELLESIPGIGNKTAARILGELPDISGFDHARHAVAYAGLSPKSHQSGDSILKKPHLSKVGNSTLRTALYWPAITALSHNPIIRELGIRLAKRGKEKMVIIGAAMRKLLVLAYGVMKTRRPFDPNYAFNLQDIA